MDSADFVQEAKVVRLSGKNEWSWGVFLCTLIVIIIVGIPVAHYFFREAFISFWSLGIVAAALFFAVWFANVQSCEEI